MKTILLSLSFAWVLFINSPTATCQGCSDAATLKSAYIGNLGTKGSDGLVHITYAFTDSSGNAITNPTMQAVFDAAFSGWNGYSSVTGVKYDPASTGTPPDLSITGDNKSNDGCLGSDSGSLNLSYGSNWLARFSDPNNVPSSIIGVEHEIGHIFGMVDNIPSIGTSLMNKASSCASGSNATGLKPSDPTSTTDAAAAGSCVKAMFQSHSPSSLGGLNGSGGGGGSVGGGGGGGGFSSCYTSYVSSNDYWQDSDGNIHVTEYNYVEETECF
jgi:hypothetical protein